MTVPVFEALLGQVEATHTFLNNLYTEKHQQQDEVNDLNRQILLKKKFRVFFPGE